MSYRIEHISEQHIPGFHAAVDAVAREKQYLAFTAAPPLDETRNFVEGNLRSGNPQFVVLNGGHVVGWCDVVRLRQDAVRHGGILGIGLLPEWRGRGIGRELMAQTISSAWARGFTRIELGVLYSNQRGLRLYESLGFRHEGRRVAAICIDGQYQDSLVMALLHPDMAQ
ncbi:GNAT family N-acetyltransferase [Viridibacterium curvum]|uniref:GNAT family protein n=1 Tax=Viridibacterium curvum TaxID=1101404 RepID=A0ABP9R287_9RHOO